MRLRTLLLIAAAVLAALHVAGVLFARPVLPTAELLLTAALLVCAVLPWPPAGWHLPVATAALVIEAALTMPSPPSDAGYAWVVVDPSKIDRSAVWRAQLEGFAPVWAALFFVAVLLLAARRSSAGRRGFGARRSSDARRGRLASPDGSAGRRRGTLIAAIAGATLIAAYATVRVAEVVLDVHERAATRADSFDPTSMGLTAAWSVLPALLLGLAALTLAASTSRRPPPASDQPPASVRDRRLVACGAALLAISCLPWIDTGLEAAQLPYLAGDDTALFDHWAITPTMAMPQPVLAITTALQLTAYVLVVWGARTWQGAGGRP
ncbi:hypothetical protein [Actinoplanes friuliensis]|uniref:Uncharacterized protein n=1 Tax=Actinoplanes friuliensis DSM 7358 TaxID=1246995 RepID=U5VTU7_9ACTN|nr:hypothetical protein [Actinoplanes friuliensis]AGZ40232.1 hypothetical protein AFR_09715 [Actinoplanes friuliensis DSM 7358]